MKMKKMIKAGITLSCCSLLGGATIAAVLPIGVQTVYAAEQPITFNVISYAYGGEILQSYPVTLNPGESKVINAPTIDGYDLTATDTFPPSAVVSYEGMARLIGMNAPSIDIAFIYEPSTPVQQPLTLSVFYQDVTGLDSSSFYAAPVIKSQDFTVVPGGSITVAASAIDGYVLADGVSSVNTVSYDQVSNGTTSLYFPYVRVSENNGGGNSGGDNSGNTGGTATNPGGSDSESGNNNSGNGGDTNNGSDNTTDQTPPKSGGNGSVTQNGGGQKDPAPAPKPSEEPSKNTSASLASKTEEPKKEAPSSNAKSNAGTKNTSGAGTTGTTPEGKKEAQAVANTAAGDSGSLLGLFAGILAFAGFSSINIPFFSKKKR